MENSVINYSPWCRSKPVRPPFIFRTQIIISLSTVILRSHENTFCAKKTKITNNFIPHFRLYFSLVDINRYFVFFAQKVFSWLHKITVDRLMSHGLLCRSSWYFSRPWSCKDPCCLWRVRELSDSNKTILICVLKMNGGLTGLERHQGE